VVVKAVFVTVLTFGAGLVASAQPCIDERAAGYYPCDRIDLLSFIPLASLGAAGTQANDLWGWADPETGREFVLLGLGNGTAFVEITNPLAPVFVGHLAAHGAASAWRDITVHKHHAYIVSEAVDHGMQVFDLLQLRDVTAAPATFTETIHYASESLSNAHNIAINEATGFAYVVGSNTCNSGLHIVNIDLPRQPRFAGCYSADGYTHDLQCVTYNGADSVYRGREVCFAFNEDTLTLVDVTDKANPTTLSRTSYDGVGYTHQGWVTDDHLFLLLGDELDEENFGHATLTRIWDIADLDRPVLIGTHVGTTPAIDHNMYIRDDVVYQANYRAGLRAFRLDAIADGRLLPIGFFDVYPSDDASEFNGAWSVYPFLPSGVIAVSAIEQGLFLLARP
jgi:choice-of-anchor B domain-containing protein